MAILIFVLFEIAVLQGLKIFNISPKIPVLYLIGYPIWIVLAFMFCMEIIPYNPEYPRFDGGLALEYILLLFLWGFGILVIPGISMIIYPKNRQRNKDKTKKYFWASLFVFLSFSLWAWVGFFTTPNISHRLFLKHNPSSKVFFKTRFDKPISWKNPEKLKTISDKKLLKEELYFMEYISNQGEWK